MKFYKILTQKKKNMSPVYHEEIFCNNFSYINGHNTFSFAVEYSPFEYNKILSKNEIFSYFLNKNISQLIMTNHRYMSLLSKYSNLNLKLVDVLFNQNVADEDCELQIAIEKQDVEMIYDELDQVLEYFQVTIKEIILRNEMGDLIKILSNGVVCLDEEYLSKGDTFSSLIDFLSLGETV